VQPADLRYCTPHTAHTLNNWEFTVAGSSHKKNLFIVFTDLVKSVEKVCHAFFRTQNKLDAYQPKQTKSFFIPPI
jgi:hypothetical protein